MRKMWIIAIVLCVAGIPLLFSDVSASEADKGTVTGTTGRAMEKTVADSGSNEETGEDGSAVSESKTGETDPGTEGSMNAESEKKVTKAQAHQYFAVTLNNRTWELLGKKDRTPAENEEMILAAHASCYHWLHAGTPVNHQRGAWLISRVYAELGMGASAIYQAQVCRELTDRYAAEMEDFDRAYAWECLARAHAAAGERDVAAEYKAKAAMTGKAIAGEEDRNIFMGDFNGGNWYGVE